ncbi:hypothetical protein Taro_033962 [Colocasia esculenta]|uniref:CCHC-type domain-containing protein n=1 Tax=Colocasia esculenta TaxID=4460 RepID=A0A843W681_COLES|nr:hypothetical protein [Colocasia esculenta]
MQTQAHTQAALQAQLEALAQVPVPQAYHGGPSIMERVKRMSPPSFKGEGNPLLAENWMREIETIFWAIRCAEDDKVTLATYMLQEQDDVWWSSLLRTRFEDGAVEVGWDEFSPKRPVASSSGQVSSQRSPSGKKECPYCGRAHGGTECWLVAGKCLKCGSSDHNIKDCPRLQQRAQRGPAPVAAAAAPATGRPGRPRAPARVFALAREEVEQADHVTEGMVLFLEYEPNITPSSSLLRNAGRGIKEKWTVNRVKPVRPCPHCSRPATVPAVHQEALSHRQRGGFIRARFDEPFASSRSS